MSIKNDIASFAMETNQNPYLLGKYAPIHTEITAENLEVIGEIPKDLHGAYVRNGPNPQFAPKGRHHWFDGDGMLHSIYLENGKATYRNRWIRTDGFNREREANGAIWTGYMDPIINNPPDAPLKDTANTDLVFFNQQILALWYLSGKPYKIDPVTLETMGIEDFDGQLNTNMAAHAKVDEETGDLMFFEFGVRPPFMSYGVYSPSKKKLHTVPVQLPGPRIPHDLAFTKNYTLLFDMSLFADPKGLRKGMYIPKFFRDTPFRTAIIPRFGSADQIKWFEAKPCYMYHTINAWEEGDEVVLVACRVAEPEPPPEIKGAMDRMLGFLKITAELYCWRFNMKTGDVKEGPLDDNNTEFPMMNTAYLGKKSQYSYNMHISEERTLLFDAIVKYDVHTGQSKTFDMGPGRYCSESPFAAKANPNSEDDGYLLTFVHDEREKLSELLIIDAKSMDSEPIAKIRIPQTVPIGFHACWAPGAELG